MKKVTPFFQNVLDLIELLSNLSTVRMRLKGRLGNF